MRINCSKFIKPYNEELDPNKKISFLTFLVKTMIGKSQDKLKNILFELCLDNNLLHLSNNNNSIVTYSSEVRRKILGEIYEVLETEFKKKGNKKLFETTSSTIIIVNYTNVLLYLL